MMFTKKFTSLLLLASCSFLSAATPLAHNQIADVGGQVHTIGRAGVLPYKDYGADGVHGTGSNWSIIIGVGNFGGKVAGPFSGSVDATDTSVKAAAARECCEETSGALDLRTQLGKLDTNNMVFSGNPAKGPQNCLFVMRDDALSVGTITEKNQQALKKQIHADKLDCWRENTHAVAIDFSTLHALLALARSGTMQQGAPVYFETRSGTVERLDKRYMVTVLNATPLLQKLTGYQFFNNLNGNIYSSANIVSPPEKILAGSFKTKEEFERVRKKRTLQEKRSFFSKELGRIDSLIHALMSQKSHAIKRLSQVEGEIRKLEDKEKKDQAPLLQLKTKQHSFKIKLSKTIDSTDDVAVKQKQHINTRLKQIENEIKQFEDEGKKDLDALRRSVSALKVKHNSFKINMKKIDEQINKLTPERKKVEQNLCQVDQMLAFMK